ncbi:hypothetical protein M5D96_010991 [Drosophila gunungcola]|uniref:Uncharacterized protein n=1 Tax=Drosophila gunungcola TaxID=103775 RepID=A0A9P9YFQ4_9MUSC|nr:hypothetical protein M5D96_010991 [Drosophila gunungcola]
MKEERFKLPDMLPSVEPRANEGWDAEPPALTYNPQNLCEEAFVLQMKVQRFKLPDMLPSVEPRANEDWDAEPPAPTYNPQN